jgi:hypothetical protein
LPIKSRLVIGAFMMPSGSQGWLTIYASVYEVSRIYSVYTTWTESTLRGKIRKKGLRSGEWSDSSGPSGGCTVGVSFALAGKTSG